MLDGFVLKILKYIDVIWKLGNSWFLRLFLIFGNVRLEDWLLEIGYGNILIFRLYWNM